MYLFLAAAETWHNIMEENEVPFRLYTYYHLRKKKNKAAIVGDLIRFKEKHPHARFFLDSGAYSLIEDVVKERRGVSAEAYVEEYLEFVEQYGHAFDIVAELDLEGIPGVTWEQIGSWQKRLLAIAGHKTLWCWHPARGEENWRLILQSDMFQWLALSNDTWKQYGRGKTQKMINQAKGAGKYIHGFGQTRIKTDMKFTKWTSMDSSSWVQAERYGSIVIFKNNQMTILAKGESREERAKRRRQYRRYFEAIGCDPDAIIADEPPAVRKACLLAWRNFSLRLFERGKARGTHLIWNRPPWNGEQQHFEGLDMTEVESHKPKKKLEISFRKIVDSSGNEKFKKLVRKNQGRILDPQIDPFSYALHAPPEMVAGLAFDANPAPPEPVNESTQQAGQFMDGTGASVEGMGSFLPPPPKKREKVVGQEFLQAYAPKRVEGPTQEPTKKVTQYLTIAELLAEEEDQDSPTAEKLRARMLGLYQTMSTQEQSHTQTLINQANPDRAKAAGQNGASSLESSSSREGLEGIEDKDHRPVLTANRGEEPGDGQGPRSDGPSEGALVEAGTEGSNVEEVKLEDGKRVYLPVLRNSTQVGEGSQRGPLTGGQRSQAISDGFDSLPSLACSSCAMAGECPEYKEGYVCAYEDMFQGMSTREADNILPIMQKLVDTDLQRTMLAIMQEKVVAGGSMDPRTSQQINSVYGKLKDMMEIRRATDPSAMRFSVTRQGGRASMELEGSEEETQGVIARLFGAPSTLEDMPNEPAHSAADAEVSTHTEPKAPVGDVIEGSIEEESTPTPKD